MAAAERESSSMCAAMSRMKGALPAEWMFSSSDSPHLSVSGYLCVQWARCVNAVQTLKMGVWAGCFFRDGANHWFADPVNFA